MEALPYSGYSFNRDVVPVDLTFETYEDESDFSNTLYWCEPQVREGKLFTIKKDGTGEFFRHLLYPKSDAYRPLNGYFLAWLTTDINHAVALSLLNPEDFHLPKGFSLLELS